VVLARVRAEWQAGPVENRARTLIGLIADTHVPEAGPELAPAVLEALAGCDQILHAGDLHTLAVVDRLEQIAPTSVSRGNGDPYQPLGNRPGVPVDARVSDELVINVGGFWIGLVHDLEHIEGRADDVAAATLARVFHTKVDIAVCGHTHVPMLWGLADGTVVINPGSAMMPYGYLGLTGTIGFIAIEADGFEVSVLEVATGATQLQFRGPGIYPPAYGPRPSGGR
jgi:putative phosphoesterase